MTTDPSGSFVERYLRRPYLVTSLVLLAAVVGFVGYRRMPVNLFPDSERPQIAVVTVYPGASSHDVEADVSRTIEKELNTIEQVRRVTSVSKDEVSAVMVEFEYSKGLDSAATDVANGLQKIEARLPGRREQGLSLLSGGERSLTAVALIFSLLKISPTPFCVLDEVDAMLDEANVGRFCELLKELSLKTQFIVITHNRNTVQAADVIYGVTMGRDSASQVISLRLDEISDEMVR